MATTVLDVVTDALTEIMAIAAGEVPSADDANNGMRALNCLVDQWAAERLSIYSLSLAGIAISGSSSSGSYIIGTGLSLVYLNPITAIPPPVYVDRLTIQDATATPALEIPLIKLTDTEWEAIPQKSLTAERPTHWFYTRFINPSETAPVAAIKIWPVPTVATTATFYYAGPVAEFTTLQQNLYLPPGYRRMIVKSLACELGPSYGRAVSETLNSQAEDAKKVVKRSNLRLVNMRFEAAALIGNDSASGTTYDINSDRVI